VMLLPATADVVEGYLDYSLRAPEELTTISMLMTLPPAPVFPAELHGKTAFMVMVCYVGDIEDGQRALDPLRNLATPLAEQLGPMPYSALFQITAGGAARGASISRSGFFSGLDRDAIAARPTSTWWR
jgi:hypothetical protein